MAAPTNLFTTTTSVGQKEDLEDVVYRVAPEKTPFLSTIGKTKAAARYHEWQTEDLSTPNADNAAVEGDDATLEAANTSVRLGNYCQIFSKRFGVSRTQEVVEMAGRSSELNRQKVLKGIELRRDMEARLIGNFARQNESGANPRKAGGILAFLTSNVSRGAGGASGTIATAATNGTTRAFTETLLKGVLATAFTNGAELKAAFMGPAHKQQFSAFTGIAQIRKDVTGREQATIVAGADVYVSDFGELTVVPVAYGLTRDCLLLDPAYAAVATLDGFKTEELAKTGDSTRKLMTHEATLVVTNEKAHGVVADLI